MLYLRIDRAHVLDQRREVLIDQLVGADLARDFLVAAAGRDQLVARRHVDTVDIGKAHRRRRRSEEHLARARLTRHLHDFAAGGAAHDGIIDQQHVLTFEFHADRVQFLAHRLLAYALPRHDESAPDVAVLDETLAIRQVEPVGELHRGGTAGVRDRDHHVDVELGVVALDLVAEAFAHAQPRLVDRNAVHHRIRPRQVHVLKQARVERRVERALLRVKMAIFVDENRLTRRDVAHELITQGIERDRFRGHQVLGTVLGLHLAVDQRTDAVGVAEREQAVARDHRHHRVCATYAPVHARYRGEDRRRVELVIGGALLQFVGKHV